MTELSWQFIELASPVIIAIVVVWLGRLSQKQFTLGCGIVLSIAVAASLYSPSVVIAYHGPEWAMGYSTWATSIATLFAIALIAIWRGFSKPGWFALFATLVPVSAISSMSAWQG